MTVELENGVGWRNRMEWVDFDHWTPKHLPKSTPEYFWRRQSNRTIRFQSGFKVVLNIPWIIWLRNILSNNTMFATIYFICLYQWVLTTFLSAARHFKLTDSAKCKGIQKFNKKHYTLFYSTDIDKLKERFKCWM